MQRDLPCPHQRKGRLARSSMSALQLLLWVDHRPFDKLQEHARAARALVMVELLESVLSCFLAGSYSHKLCVSSEDLDLWHQNYVPKR